MKKSADWYIAATHWLTSVVSSAIFGAIIFFILALVTQNQDIFIIAAFLVQPLVMWFAVKYSAHFVNGRYIINNPQSIVISSFIYFLVVNGGYQVYLFSTTGVFSTTAVGFILSIAVFYLASKKYIKSNDLKQTKI